MTPVAKTGLHCGDDLGVVPAIEIRQVTPVAKTGLHCGRSAELDWHHVVDG